MRRLHDSLLARSYDVWVDWEDIPPSAEWFAEIRTGVRNADGFIYVISPDSISSDICARELDNAVEQNKRVIPVVCREPAGVPVPESAAALNWVFLRDSDDFEAGVQTLISALETDLDHVRVHTRLGVQADRWETSGRDPSRLLRGSELSAAEAWLVAGGDKQPEATQRQREYLLASRQAATRRQRTVIGAVTFALAVAVVLAIVAVVQRSTAIHERNVAYARALDADAQANLNTDPELSVLLAMRAARVQASSGTEAALRQALADSNVRIRYALPVTGAAGDVLPSPDGRRLLLTGPAVGAAAWARIYPSGSSQPLVRLPGPPTHGASAWDHRGDRVVIGGANPRVYDARTAAVLLRLPTPALQVALTPDGRRVVTVGFNGLGLVYDVATGRRLVAFHPRYTGGATCFALAPNGRYAAQCDALTLSRVTNDPENVDIWSVASGRLVRSVANPNLVESVSFSPDSRRFAYTTTPLGPLAHATTQASVAFEGKPGTLVYATTGHRGPLITFPGAASVAEFGPNPSFQTLAYATLDDNIVHIYDFYSGRNFPLSGATAAVQSLAWDYSGRYLAAGGNDDTVRIYDSTTGGPPVETLSGHRGNIDSIGFTRSAQYVATSSDDGTTRLWQGPTPTPILQRSDAPLGDGGVPSAGFVPGSNRLVIGGAGNGLAANGRILGGGSLKTLGTFGVPSGQLLAGDLVSTDGRTIAALAAVRTGRSGALAGTAIDTFDAGTGAHLATLRPAGGRALYNAVPNHTGSEIATEESGGRVELWGARSGRLLHSLVSGETSAVAAVAFSVDGRQLAVAHSPAPVSPGRPVVVQLWDVQTGRLLHSISAEPQNSQIPSQKDYSPLGVAFSPDGRTLAVSGAQTNIQLFSTSTGASVHPPLSIAGGAAGSYAAFVNFSPDGTELAAGSASGAYVWRVPSYQLLPVFQHVPQGAPLVTAASEVHVGFTQDSRELITYGENTFELWDVADHLQLFSTAPAAIATANLSRDGSQIVTAGTSGISVYPCSLCGGIRRLLAAAAQRVTRSLTPAERNRYLTSG